MVKFHNVQEKDVIDDAFAKPCNISIQAVIAGKSEIIG
jgi:hypothetical protein